MSVLSDYSDRNATKEVIGCLMQQPTLIKKHKIDYKMFAETFYQYIFLAIEHLIAGGAKIIDTMAVEDYLEQYPSQYKNFKNNNGEELLLNIEENAILENFEYNLELVKKFSLLRDFKKEGIDVNEIFNPDDYEFKILEAKRRKLETMSVNDIIIHFSHKQRKITSKYETNITTDTKKAGVDGIKQLESWKENVEWGLGYASAYLNTALYGIRQRHFVVKSAASGTGKALPNDTLIPTPIGWRKVGDIKKGDYLFGQDGKPTKVLQVHPQPTEKDIWEVVFADERKALCCKDHLWEYLYDNDNDNDKQKEYRVETTEEIYNRAMAKDYGFERYSHKGFRFRVRQAEPVEYPTKKLSDNPYIMGSTLGKESLKDENIFISEEYLMGDIEQRYSLLQGLLDSNGCINEDGRITITIISRKLKDNIIELCHSLGMMALYKIDIQEKYSSGQSYIVEILCKKEDKPKLFKLGQQYQIALEYSKSEKRCKYPTHLAIIDIHKTTEKTSMTCFTVDNSSHLFLTNDFLVTHNTRTTLSDIAHAFAPKYYDKKSKQWCVNPNGTNNKCLYIGTEMELLTEIDPILWAYMADVPQDHIKFNQYEDDEEERVREAIRILEEEGNIFLAYCPEYTVEELVRIIEDHKVEYDITAVFFDYIHTTGNLIAEYSANTNKNMAVREDQVLSDLSTKLKNICRKYNISFDTCTQVNGDFRKTTNKDESVVSGAKSIINKSDVAMICSRPTEKELKLVERYLRVGSHKGSLTPLKPNVVYSIYKNRDGKYVNIKVWLHIDYSTMRTHDLFVTDYDYKILKDFPRVYINITKQDHITYDEGETIYVTQADEINAEVDNIKKEIGLDSYELNYDETEENEIKEGCIHSEEEYYTW